MNVFGWIPPVLAACIVLAALTGRAGEAPDPRASHRNHHTENGFRNLHVYDRPTFVDFLKWRWNRIWKDIPSAESFSFALAKNAPRFLQNNRTARTITWIGHATVLLQLDGKNILTDPHFSDRASPVQWMGPKRVVPPGLTLDDLPRIDLVVLSHDHYDSLDRVTMERLRHREGGDETVFAVPLGLRGWFNSVGVTNVVEFDWWQSRTLKDLRVTAVPVHHWSQRVPFSRNTTLWAGWVVQSEDFRFFFAGDSGYTPIFKEIGQRLGPFDLSAIPIGAYEPRWFMRHHHINPEESVQVHLDTRSKKSVAIHWGTFMLTDEPLDEPPERLANALKANDLSEQDFIVMEHGETILLDEASALVRHNRLDPYPVEVPDN